MKGNKYLKANDISIKYAEIMFPKHLHHFLGLPGEFLKPCPTHLITADKRDLDMDILYHVYTDRNLLINLEQQTTPVRDDKILALCQYRDYSKTNYGIPVLSVVVSSVDPSKSINRFELTKSDIIVPQYFFISWDGTIEILNKIENIISNNDELEYDDALYLAFLPIFAPKNHAESLVERSCHLFSKANIDHYFKRELVFVVKIMIEKHIGDKSKVNELKELINLDEAVDEVLLSVALNEDLNAKLKEKEREFMSELNKKDTEFKLELDKKDNDLKNMGVYKNVLMELKKKGIINDSMLNAMNFNIVL
ncbi:MAG: hypothetical protein IJQ68_00830 [Methanobrevibacter sp.]|uniref:hypothetical protein n=1 Tax=Methanobrevibacter sp. TaxID=66852 RepID=UPI0025E0D8E6|nr:hypothetical protein [Methanobrevibacter sp.]MBR0270531.1 hypothetical protein [Methanobrevibacter sp.]